MNMRLTVNEPVPRMYTQIYTPTVVQGGGGGRGLWMDDFMGGGTTGGLSVTNNDRHLGHQDFTKNWKSG